MEPPKLKIQMVLSPHVGAGNRKAEVLWKSSQGSYLTAEPSLLSPNLFKIVKCPDENGTDQ